MRMARTQALMIQIATGDARPICRPIGRQILDAIRMKVATGELGQGDQLPSVRGLAQQLMVNPNTVAKAYAELTAEGWRRLDDAIGRFVNDVIPLDFPPGEVEARVAHEFQQLAPRKIA